MITHNIRRETFHYLWNNEHEPAIHIDSGDTVHFEINDVTSWQLTEKATLNDLARLDMSKLYPLAGPVYVEGASPGDAISVEVVEVSHANWGWSCIVEGLGLLPEFKEPYLHIWDLSTNSKFAEFKNGIKVPLDPFCGVMGVAPKEKGAFDVLPPGKNGGNMDIKHLTRGSKVILPVLSEGALFSVGDLHAAMGDGELCLTAIECPGEALLKFEVIRGEEITSPRVLTPGRNEVSDSEKGGYYVTTGISPDLMECCRLATRSMINFLVKEYPLSREDAYILCSVAADLRIHEVVDAPNWVVGLWMPNIVLGR